MTWDSYLILLIAASALSAEPEVREARVVTTSQGPVRGYRAPDGDYFAFYGIPYATVPTGHLKYTAPLPGPVWLQPLEAVNADVICPQFEMITRFDTNKVTKEDCLLANIYIPDTTEKNLPVLVIVHGGAYQLGFGDLYMPNGLVKSKKVIAVTFNYRLGIHGFLCLGTPDVPGNAGMKDQVALLRWVQKNISKFGGNPDNVTIYGYSAGASSVDLLLLSKMAKGLFNKVIADSGSNVGVWSVQIDPLENAKAYAKDQGFTNIDDIYALEEFYKSAPFDVLTNTDYFLHAKDSTFVFSPCVERNIGIESFLDDTPVNILTDGKFKKVPVLYGFSNMEGIFNLHHFETWKVEMNRNFSAFLPIDLQFESEKQKYQVAKSIKEFYFGDKSVEEDTILSYIDYFTDVLFAYPILRSVELQVAAGSESIYLYEYSFPVNVFPKYIKPAVIPKYIPKIHGARHCAQTEAVLDSLTETIVQEPLSDVYKKHKTVIKELWLNFITNSEPLAEVPDFPAWPATGAGCSPHMSLGVRAELRDALLPARLRFWQDVYARHYRQPQAPPTPPPKHTEL